MPPHYGRRMEITACTATDVALLDQYLASPGRTSFHARRFSRQEAGECTYLVARLDGRPVGHAEMRWIGCTDPEVRDARPGCPEIGGLAVAEDCARAASVRHWCARPRNWPGSGD